MKSLKIARYAQQFQQSERKMQAELKAMKTEYADQASSLQILGETIRRYDPTFKLVTGAGITLDKSIHRGLYIKDNVFDAILRVLPANRNGLTVDEIVTAVNEIPSLYKENTIRMSCSNIISLKYKSNGWMVRREQLPRLEGQMGANKYVYFKVKI